MKSAQEDFRIESGITRGREFEIFVNGQVVRAFSYP